MMHGRKNIKLNTYISSINELKSNKLCSNFIFRLKDVTAVT